MRVRLVQHGTVTKKVLNLNRKLVGALLDKVRGRDRGHTRALLYYAEPRRARGPGLA